MTSQSKWNDAVADAKILEETISRLVEEFESKHRPIQCSILTRYRLHSDRYSLSKGGAAQLKLHDRSDATSHPDIIIRQFDAINNVDIVYAED